MVCMKSAWYGREQMTRTLMPILRVPAGESIEAVQPLARVEVIAARFAIDREGVRVEGDVDLAPPHILLRGGVDDGLVLGERPVLTPE